MRQVGSLSNLDQAERFADYLRSEGTECSIDNGSDGFRIWVQDDDRVAAAKQELPIFLADPNHMRYRDASVIAKTRLIEKQLRREAARSNTIDVSNSWSASAAQQCPVTFGLIAISILVGILTGLKPVHNDPFVSRLWISTNGSIQQILHGEIWRIISPIFLHFNLMHIVFNLLWTYQFGLQIEPRRGSSRFLAMVLVIAALSNLAQFWSPNLVQFWFHGLGAHPRWLGNPWFGGMSGVVYGLFGYIWIKGKLDPRSGLGLPQQTVFMMLGWHVLCVVGVIPNVANWCHGIGLVTGMALAAGGLLLPSRIRRR
ncbi:MAG: rhomboid family intramembrane serine protease [Schlesneria sp.]